MSNLCRLALIFLWVSITSDVERANRRRDQAMGPMKIGVLLGSGGGRGIDESRLSTKRAKLTGAYRGCRELQSQWERLGGYGSGGLNLGGSAHP